MLSQSNFLSRMPSNSPSFGKLVLQSTAWERTPESGSDKVLVGKSDPNGHAWPIKTLDSFVKNKEVQKLVAESEMANLDVLATYNGTHYELGTHRFNVRQTPHIQLALAEKDDYTKTKVLETFDAKLAHLFKSDEYVNYSQNVVYLNEFNNAMSKLSQQFKKATNKMIDELNK